MCYNREDDRFMTCGQGEVASDDTVRKTCFHMGDPSQKA